METGKLGVIQMRSNINAQRSVKETLKLLGLTKIHTARCIQDSDSKKGMIKKVEGYVTWGELKDDTAALFNKKNTIRLHPPKKGFRSKRAVFPKGELGYRGEKINDLLKKMSE